MKKILLFLCTILCANVLFAQTRFIVGELQYEVTGTNEVEVHDCMPSATSIVIQNTVTYQGTNYSVTKIGEDAFEDCSSLTSVTIPNSVTYIGASAFANCSSLTSVTIPNSVTSIAESAFKNCRSITSIDIPNSIIYIGWYAFEGCSSLTSVTIPNSLTSINAALFRDCSSLTSVTIPNSVTYIGSGAFRDCSSLTSVTLPNNATIDIKSGAFRDCSSLTSVTLPNNATIDNSAFSDIGDKITIDSITYSIPTASIMIGFNNFSNVGFTSFYLGDNVYRNPATDMKVYDCDTNKSGEVVIPSAIEINDIEYPVTSIGYSAFQSCSSLTSIDIPNSVTSIGDHSFEYCSSLTSVTIPNSVTSIGYAAFNRCYDLTSVTCLAETAPSLGSSVFSHTPLTKTLIVPCESDYSAWESATTWASVNEDCPALEIGDRFTIGYLTYEVTAQNEVKVYDCDVSAIQIEIPSIVNDYNVTSIGDYAFFNCSSLTSVTIPNSVTSIGERAFGACSSLTSITIPNSVTSIGNDTFNGCSSLDSIICLAETAPSLGSFVFHFTPSTKTLTYPCGSDYSTWQSATTWASVECTWDLGNSLTYFPLTFEIISEEERTMKVSDCDESATVVEIPARVMYNGALYDVTSIGESAFWNCNSFISNCSSLTSVTIPNSVTSIGNYAFYNCSSLTSITIPNSVTSIGNSAFGDCRSLTSVDIPNSVTSIGNSAFNNCDSLTSVTIGNSVTSIGNWSFGNCSSLTSVNIPNSVTSIGDNAFYGCRSLTSIDIPNSVTSIGNQAFEYCSSLTSIDIPNSVTSIGEWAFTRCSSLTSVTIPNSVTSIRDYTFYYCSSLDSITCLAETAPSLGSSVFSGTPSTKTLTVPCESDYSAWESATTWASVERIGCEEEECVDVFTIGDLTYEKTSATEVSVKDCDSTATEVIIPASVEQCGITYSVTSIGDNAFEGCSSLTSIDIPNGVTSIGNYAFWLCDNLTSIDIPNSVTSIGNSAFRNCSSLTSITIPNSVTSIGNSAFQSCSSLTSITIPNSVTSIGDGAFNGCSNLTSITIPNSITSIGTSTFSGCSNLTSITIPNSVTSIAGLVFSNCSSLTSVTIGNGVTSIGMWAFSGCSDLDSITCLAETAPSLGSSAFSGTPSTKTLTVPFGSNYSAWQSATTWAKTNYLIQKGETKILETDFTINANTSLINNGVLRIKPTGQLINRTSTNVSGVFEIETPTLPDDKWSFVGAPFNGYKLEAIKEGTRDVAVSVFDYDSADWSEEFATIETPIGKGEGFLLWSFAEEATVFTTNPENPSEEYTLNNGGVSVTETLTTQEGEGGGNWMALANPYTFKLDIATFLEDQSDVNESDVKGGCVYRLNGVSWEEVSEGVIGLTEGFFVNYANPGSQTATFVKSHRYTGTSSKAEKKKEYIKLYMNDGERISKLSIAQNEEASQGDDIFDANKLFSPFEIAEPYFLTEGVALVKEEVKTLPYTATLNVKSYESKEVTFSVGDIPEDYNVYLIDNGFDIKMNDGVEYNTRIVAGENADRFKFVIKKAHRLTETVNKDIYVNNFNREVRISSTQKDLKIEVYDALGRKVFETKDYKFELNQVPAGAYMVKVYNRFARKDAKIVLH